jgi:uncharacterized integral membrane protein
MGGQGVFRGLLKRITWLFLFLWCACLVLIGAKFAQNNPAPLKVDLIFWTAPESSSGLVLSLALLGGVLLGILMFAPVVLIHRARIRRLNALVTKLEPNAQGHQLTPLRS